MKKGILFVILALALILAGLVLVSISQTKLSRDAPLVNAIVRVQANESYATPYGVSASYYLDGSSSNGRINGTLLMVQQCCVNFYIFTTDGFGNWTANNQNATNSTNSPVYAVNSSAIDSKSGVSTSFSFVPDPAKTYELVFYNANRSLWNTNTSVVYHVVADIYLDYSQAPAADLIYPGAALLITGVTLIFVRYRHVR